MKFCKNLQRVADLSNPEWAAYWTDYKQLKKIIKKLSDVDIATVDVSEKKKKPQVQEAGAREETGKYIAVDKTTAHLDKKEDKQQLNKKSPKYDDHPKDMTQAAYQEHAAKPKQSFASALHPSEESSSKVDALRRTPEEVQFFKLLHGEFQKAVHFFDRIIAELKIREERVVDGIDIVKREERFDLWNAMTKSVYRLYTDLLLLENFCIMTYCSFSKILKKHDKVTGVDTRNAFMSNIVNNANFTNYTNLQDMIRRCEELYRDASDRILQAGQQELYEDERLFIDMVHQLNQQV